MDFHFIDFFRSLDITLPNALFALGAAVLSYLLMHGALIMFRKRLGTLSTDREHGTIAQVLSKTLAHTGALAIVATAILIGLSVLDLPEPWNTRLGHLWFFTLGIQIAMFLHRAVKIASRRYFLAHNPGAVDQQVTVAHTVVIWLLQTTVWVVFVLAMLSNLGINVTTFVASLGIGGVAIALAVQNILGDLFASMSIAVDKPFEVGDFISAKDYSGTVEHVGLKTTRLRALGGEQIVVANAELLRSTVYNFRRMTTRRIVFALRASPATPPRLAGKVPGMLAEIVKCRDKVRFDRAHLKTVDQNWIEYEIVYTMLDASFDLYMDTQQAINLDAMQMFADLGISMAPRPQHVLLQEAPDARADVRGEEQAAANELVDGAGDPAADRERPDTPSLILKH
ncbi:mechanosensitive ion channel family protein [Massilia sp. G4R7]|uniref:Mechanosensitive ion channel family protein n=1 Tax=Massilia phyllostachyos TaxID=2898585 RepID=A0ABS8Q895_9BURK|nr:mechanosensitive ion channel family protein [Massilia phyllostachyos]MCD2516830.1 mechanosensitive ion channel family protein [Massilia phyllostachyos]